jgi:hypothetical protein
MASDLGVSWFGSIDVDWKEGFGFEIKNKAAAWAQGRRVEEESE